MADDSPPTLDPLGDANDRPRPDRPAPHWQQPPQGTSPDAYPLPPAPDYWSPYPSGYVPGGQPPAGYVPPYPGPMAPSTSGWAIASLILAIGGWTILPLLGAIGGVVTGHIALHEIGSSDGRIEGRGFAIAGLVVGYAGLVLALCAFIFVFGLLVGSLQQR